MLLNGLLTLLAAGTLSEIHRIVADALEIATLVMGLVAAYRKLSQVHAAVVPKKEPDEESNSPTSGG